jgi:hypothetical protein
LAVTALCQHEPAWLSLPRFSGGELVAYHDDRLHCERSVMTSRS